MDYRKISKNITESLTSVLSSTGSYTSRETPTKAFYGRKAEQAFAYQGPLRNPVIVIHGFLGAALNDPSTGKELWGIFDIRESIAVSPEKMTKVAHPMSFETPIQKIPENLQAGELLQDVTLQMMGFQMKMPAYKDLLDVLRKGGYTTLSEDETVRCNYQTLFPFGYDWRRDLQWNAARLHEFIKEKRKELQNAYMANYGIENYDVQFDIIAHSMGGLLSRYYLRFGAEDMPDDYSTPRVNWSGSDFVDRLIIVGTPNAGYLDTLLELINGSPLQPYPATVLGTLPSYYQMLPAPQTRSIIYSDNAEMVDIFDVETWISLNWGLAAKDNDEVLKILIPDAANEKERREIAIDHLDKCLKRAKQFINAMSLPLNAPDDVALHLVCGNGIKTTKRAEVNRKTGEIKVVEYGAGDGKVLTSSTLWDRRGNSYNHDRFLSSPINWSSTMLLRAAHMGIMTTPGFEDNLLFLLTMKASKKQQRMLEKK